LSGRRRPLAAAVVLAATLAVLSAQPALAGTVDGISDQSLPAWDGGFAASPLAAWIAELARDPARRLRFARYVVQWDAMSEPSALPGPAGDYRERFESWLIDVRALGLQPVLALTSYDRRRPATRGEYATALAALLTRARGLGRPIAYLEPWNEPNNQGAESALVAAEQANEAGPLCASDGCTVIAGDLEDGPGMLTYEHQYEKALTFAPVTWGMHPYRAIASRSLETVAAFRSALPARGHSATLWATEVGAFHCRNARELGDASQAGEAAYIAGPLAQAFGHALYYGVEFADGLVAPCTLDGSADSELFAPGDRPRPAAAIVLGASVAGGWPLIGPLPGDDALAFAPLAGG
jgi:hypothetical protein